MFEKSVRDLTASDIESLVTTGYREEQRLDYKEQFPSSAEDRNDLTRHVVGMANTRGGYIVLGIKERRDSSGKPTGEPESICGLAGVNLDAECLRLSSSVRDLVRPRIVPVPEVAVIETSGGPTVVVRVQKSFTKPHMYGHRFYARQGAQTVLLEVEQIRAEFLESETLTQRLRDFRADRLGDVVSGSTPDALERPASMVVHVCPLAAFATSRLVDAVAVQHRHVVPPGRLGNFGYRLNFLGALSTGRSGTSQEYLQVFRNGCLEFATTDVIDPANHSRSFPLIRIQTLANLLAADVPRTIGELGPDIVPFPLVIMVSILGAREARAMVDQHGHDWTRPIHENRMLLPEIVLQSVPDNWGAEMRPMLDSVWQSTGVARCPYYDQSGQFVRNG